MKTSRRDGRETMETYFSRIIPVNQRAAAPKEVSKIYGIPVGTLANLRCQKRGPKYFRRGRSILYFLSDIEIWLRQDPVLTIDTYETEDGL